MYKVTFVHSNRCNITPSHAEKLARVTFRIMKLGHYVKVDDRGKYVTYHDLNICIKIKK